MSEAPQSLFKKYLETGLSAKEAAKKAQAETGMSVVTGKEIKQNKLKFSTRGVKYGQYPTI